MAEVTSDLIYEVLKKIQDQLAVLTEGQRAIREEVQAMRGHQLATQRDISRLFNLLHSSDARLMPANAGSTCMSRPNDAALPLT